MGVPCMPVRTKCVVIGTELHDALGTLIAPPAPPVPCTPSKITLWTSASTTYYGIGEKPVAKVMICGEPAVNKGADTTYARPHVVMFGIAPPNVIVGPVVDWGFFILVIAMGGTKPVWGPRSVQADSKSIAVFAIPHSPYCPFNQMICNDPFDIPLGVGLQMPSSVFAGMTLGDYALCIVNIVADMLLSLLLNMIFGGLDFLGDFIGKKLAASLGKLLNRKLLKIFGKKIFKFINKGLERLTEMLSRKLVKEFGTKSTKSVIKRATEGLAKIGVELAKKYAEKQLGNLSPGGPLGFGNGPPEPAGETP
jgi:hypothetical protein